MYMIVFEFQMQLGTGKRTGRHTGEEDGQADEERRLGGAWEKRMGGQMREENWEAHGRRGQVGR